MEPNFVNKTSLLIINKIIQIGRIQLHTHFYAWVMVII